MRRRVSAQTARVRANDNGALASIPLTFVQAHEREDAKASPLELKALSCGKRNGFVLRFRSEHTDLTALPRAKLETLAMKTPIQCFTIVAAFLSLTPAAFADSPHDVSPAHCQPLVPSVDGPLLKFQNGAWEFLSGQTGTARLVCAVPHQYDLAFPGPCVDGSFCEVFRIDYRDSDGTSSATQVTAQLHRRRSSGSSAALTLPFDSNNFSTTGNTNKLQYADDNYTKVNDQTVYLQVTLKRGSTSQTARFSGFQFLGPLP